ncbi:MAG: hypothetical protein A3H64_00170 [Candidatus Ryanbacteria bacterium RIFCSPLOWO2_02_FULL_45_11c]|uniref:Uncharacterized protein n=1 Tax=Candidatus Ryanbacteria bacterium RIFCSPLOWO2_02_FULL_45_11c TaxID=1802128 RepID=A0A1G2GTF4_9BACT|nr:MAG: hypothetical protein A3H64_00170 [Candidatus Ryanbacteria bacterium RIFCSPLOWO2_02_FULL_45_11c]
MKRVLNIVAVSGILLATEAYANVFACINMVDVIMQSRNCRNYEGKEKPLGEEYRWYDVLKKQRLPFGARLPSVPPSNIAYACFNKENELVEQQYCTDSHDGYYWYNLTRRIKYPSGAQFIGDNVILPNKDFIIKGK